MADSHDILLLAYSFDMATWSDTPFQTHRLPPELRGEPGGTPDGALALTTVLVDAQTGIVKALRVDDLPSDFSGVLRALVADQLAHPFDDLAAEHKLNQIYADHQTSESMVAALALAICRSDGPVLGGSNPLSINYY